MKTQFFSFRNAVIAILFFTFIFAPALKAQDNPSSIYMKITKLKKQNDDLMDVEKEILQPYVQERIKQGNQLAHAMFRVHYPNSDDEAYDYIMMDVYNDFSHLNLGDQKMGEMAFTVFPNFDYKKTMDRYKAAAKYAGSEVFVIRDEAFPGPKGATDKIPKFVQVNHMKVSEANTNAYADMENSIYKPLHQARGKAGEMHDWLLLERIMPYGSEWDNTFITFDVYYDWSQMAGGLNNHFEKVHPDKDPAAVWEKMANIRELRRAETWELVAMVNEPADEVTYSVVNEGTGAAPMRGQEVSYRGKLMNTKGETLFDTDELGFTFHTTLGEYTYDRYFDKGLMKMKKGGIMNITLPPAAQDKWTKSMSGGETAILKVEVVDIGMPKPNGAEMLKKVIMKDGIATAKEQYKKVQSSNPEGYVFREGDMNSLGYQLMGEGHHAAAIYIFDLNTKNYPKSWNACDSLADGYKAAGDYVKAKHCYEMALKINPDFTAAKDKLSKL